MDQRRKISKRQKTTNTKQRDQVFADDRAREYVDGIAMHWYADWDEYPSPDPLDEIHQFYPDKFQLYTEACNGSSLMLNLW